MAGEEAFFIAKKITQTELMGIACSFRFSYSAATHKEFNAVTALEHVLPLLDTDFNYHIIEAASWRFGVHVHALCLADRHTILIRDDVYDGAFNHNEADSMTIMHEIAHYLLFAIHGIPVRTERTALPFGMIPENQNPEIQADTLAGFILNPDYMISQWKGSLEELLYLFLVKPVTQIIVKEILRAEAQYASAHTYTYKEVPTDNT